YHNTPQVKGEEINRFVRPDYLWVLHDEARPEVYRWKCGADLDLFEGAHTGYHRLGISITPVRALALDHRCHGLAVVDRVQGTGVEPIDLEVPLHLAIGVEVAEDGPGRLLLTSGGRRFRLAWFGVGTWHLAIEPGRVSPTYGVAFPCWRLAWRFQGLPRTSLLIFLPPLHSFPQVPKQWGCALLGTTWAGLDIVLSERAGATLESCC